MKILMISNMYPSDSYPSYGVFVKNTEKILTKAGFVLDKLVMLKETNRLNKVKKYLIYFMKIILRGLSSDYDVIYVHYGTHNAIPLNVLKLLKPSVQIFINLHGSDVVPETKIQNLLQSQLRKMLKNSSKIITPSEYYKGLVSRKYDIDGKRIEVFPSGGVNPDVFYPIENRRKTMKELDLDPSFCYFGYVGRLDYKKGWDVFLDAVKELKDKGQLLNRRAIVVGSGKEKPKFLEKAKALQIEEEIIHFDLLPQDKLLYIYNALDVFCFPTMREGESLGLVGLEAMACGTPVIGSKIGGLLDYVRDGINGYLFDEGDSKELTNKVIQFYSLAENQKYSMSSEALNMASKYYVKNIELKLKTIFTL